MFCEHIEQSSQLFRLFQMSLGNEINDLLKREKKTVNETCECL